MNQQFLFFNIPHNEIAAKNMIFLEVSVWIEEFFITIYDDELCINNFKNELEVQYLISKQEK